MIGDLGRLDGWVDEKHWPRMRCPVCEHGSVGFNKATHHLDRESEEIVELANRNQGPPDELSGTFEGTLECDDKSCGQLLSVAGDWGLWFNEGDPADGQFGEVFRVRYVNPPLKILHVPEKIPVKVKVAIDSASAVLWLSPAAAANRLRQAVEELLTAQRVRKTMINKYKKRVSLKLHARIDLYSKINKDVGDALLAVKWIGNDGSHDSTLHVKDVLLGAEILDVAITALYDKSADHLKAKVKAINKRAGSPKSSPAALQPTRRPTTPPSTSARDWSCCEEVPMPHQGLPVAWVRRKLRGRPSRGFVLQPAHAARHPLPRTRRANLRPHLLS